MDMREGRASMEHNRGRGHLSTNLILILTLVLLAERVSESVAERVSESVAERVSVSGSGLRLRFSGSGLRLRFSGSGLRI